LFNLKRKLNIKPDIPHTKTTLHSCCQRNRFLWVQSSTVLPLA